MPQVKYKTVKVGDLDIFYREAGPKDAPAVLLLHGFPTSSQMFRNLIPALADKYHVVAPDYPGFGHSSMPPHDKFAYTFDNLAKVIDEVHREDRADELRPVRAGLRCPGRLPAGRQAPGADHGHRGAERQRLRRGARQRLLEADQGVLEGADQQGEARRPAGILEPTKRRSGSTPTGSRNAESISPDGWTHDQFLLDRKGNDEIQLDLFLSYGSNPPLYPRWQEYFRKHQPPMLIVWGKNDQIFPPAGAEPYKRDLKTLEYHLLDAGHFALEERGRHHRPADARILWCARRSGRGPETTGSRLKRKGGSGETRGGFDSRLRHYPNSERESGLTPGSLFSISRGVAHMMAAGIGTILI